MLKKITITFVAALGLLCTLSSAQAGMMNNQDLYLENLRGQVTHQLNTPELAHALSQQGIELEQAQARIDRLSIAELQQLSTQLEQAPAGGEGFVTAIIIAFAILVVTDALGYTDLFPFVEGPE